MDWPFDVFVSYAHADAEFVRPLVKRLRSAGLAVWLDEERLPGGIRTKDAIDGGLAASRHLLVVVSDAWEGRDWTAYELGVFKGPERDSRRRAIPLVRMTRCHRKRLGPELASETPVLWPPDQRADDDAGLWQVLCAIRGQPPGPREEWAGKGAGARGDVSRAEPPVMDPGPVRGDALARNAGAPLALLCDRNRQWGDVVARAASPQHQVWFVTGAVGEGHAEFLERIRQWLPNDPRREVLTVRWPPQGAARRVPVDAADALTHIARRLDCRPEAAAARLRRVVDERNLVLLHDPELCGGYDRDDLFEYYVHTVPQVLGLVSAGGALRHGVKFVQALAWAPASPLGRAAAQVLRAVGWGSSRWVQEHLQALAARRLVERVGWAMREPTSPIGVVRLAELSPIKPDDVLDWLATDGRALVRAAGVDDVDGFVRGVFAGGARSEDVLRNLMRYLGATEGG